MALLSLPWSWKPLWAPLIDRFGPRRAWIVPCLGALAAIAFVMPLLPAEKVGPLTIAFLLTFTLASATQDIAIDAWAVDAATGRDLGLMNGIARPSWGRSRPAASLCWWLIAASWPKEGRLWVSSQLAVSALFKGWRRALESVSTTRGCCFRSPGCCARRCRGALRALKPATRRRQDDRDLRVDRRGLTRSPWSQHAR
jgi:MFS family permease